jgi:hypothetical protein
MDSGGMSVDGVSGGNWGVSVDGRSGGNQGSGDGWGDGVDESVLVDILRESLESQGPEAVLGGDEASDHGVDGSGHLSVGLGHGGGGGRGGQGRKSNNLVHHDVCKGYEMRFVFSRDFSVV